MPCALSARVGAPSITFYPVRYNSLGIGNNIFEQMCWWTVLSFTHFFQWTEPVRCRWMTSCVECEGPARRTGAKRCGPKGRRKQTVLLTYNVASPISAEARRATTPLQGVTHPPAAGI